MLCFHSAVPVVQCSCWQAHGYTSAACQQSPAAPSFSGTCFVVLDPGTSHSSCGHEVPVNKFIPYVSFPWVHVQPWLFGQDSILVVEEQPLPGEDWLSWLWPEFVPVPVQSSHHEILATGSLFPTALHACCLVFFTPFWTTGSSWLHTYVVFFFFHCTQKKGMFLSSHMADIFMWGKKRCYLSTFK